MSDDDAPDAYEQGQDAYERGKQVTACPYLAGSGERELWIAGWHDAGAEGER